MITQIETIAEILKIKNEGRNPPPDSFVLDSYFTNLAPNVRRDFEAVRLRDLGKTFLEIGNSFGVSAPRARVLFDRACRIIRFRAYTAAKFERGSLVFQSKFLNEIAGVKDEF